MKVVGVTVSGSKWCAGKSRLQLGAAAVRKESQCHRRQQLLLADKNTRGREGSGSGQVFP